MAGAQNQNIFNQSAFGRRLGLTRQAINYAVKAGHLILNEKKKIDIRDPINAKFIKLQETKVKAGGKHGTGRPYSFSSSTDEARGRAADQIAQGKFLDNRLKAVRLAQKRLEYSKEIRDVIPLTIVSRSVSSISALLNENFRAFDERNCDELFEASKEGKRKLAETLTRLINESMETVLRGVETEINNLELEKIEVPQ